MAEFYSARGCEIPPLPWTNLSPPFSKDGIRAKTRRTRGQSLTRIIDDLNPMLKGWYGYFQHAHPNTFRAMDQFVRRRLRAVLRKQARRPGLGHCLADHQRWPNTFFAVSTAEQN